MSNSIVFSQKHQDAAFFDMVAQLVQSNQLLQEPGNLPAGAEKRREKRLPYPYVQLMAPFDGYRLPDQHEFRHVQCNDISPSGFSFYDSPLPTYDKVVILIGPIPFRIFSAEVRHVQKTAQPDLYLVGCRILKRLAG